MHIFDFYQAVLENTIETAKRDGKYDEGIVDVKGTSITLAEPQKVCISCDIQYLTLTCQFSWPTCCI